MGRRLGIGLLAIGGRHWIAGVNYVINLARAIRSLPFWERPRVYLVQLEHSEWDLYSEVRGHVPAIRVGSPPPLRWRLLDRSRPEKPSVADRLIWHRVDCVFPCKFQDGPEYGVPWLGWAVDFQHRYLPELYDAERLAQREELFEWHGRMSPLVINSSRQAVADYARYHPGYEDKLRVLHFRTVPDPAWFRADAREVVRSYGLPEKYLMVPNQFFPHKNHLCAVRALAHARTTGRRIDLVCTGQTTGLSGEDYYDSVRAEIARAGLDGSVHLLGLIPRFDQVQLMRAAAAVVQPSLFEGWSSVVEDARALAKPIFVSDILVHREQKPLGGVFFSPEDPEQLGHLLDQGWDGLRAGPDRSAERRRRRAHAAEVRAYARRFVGFAAEAVGRWSGSA